MYTLYITMFFFMFI